MPGAQAQRLLGALDEFIASYTGDTGTRGGSVRGAVDTGAAAIVQEAQALRDKLSGAYGGPSSSRDTPGSRAVAAAGGGAGFAGARSRARGSMTGAGA